jgi:uncharacterized protein DUF3375
MGSDLRGELARLRESFDKPAMRLFDRKWAPLVLAVFRVCFTRDQRSVAAERMHAQVDTYLDELRSVGEETPPVASGRALCVQWMNDQWLFRNVGENGQEEYSLTSHALEALDVMSSLSRDRPLISESRISTIIEAARRWATEANPDREARIERLNAQIQQIEAERDRLESGGELAPATDDRMLDGYTDLIDLIGQLPSDFKRVEESVLDMHRKIISDFRNEDRPIGEVIDEYLRKTDELTMLTPEGRAFDGAFALLCDDALLLELRNDLQTVLDHPFAQALTAAEQREFRGAGAVIRAGIDDVLTQRSKLTATLREHIVNHDVVRDRELDALLRRVNQLLAIWMETAGPRSTIPIDLVPTQLAVAHLRERFWDPAAHLPPPRLEDVSAGAPAPPSLEEIRTHGGPSLTRLRSSLVTASRSGGPVTLAGVFNDLPTDLRRPVEILGLLHLAAEATPPGTDEPGEARTPGPMSVDRPDAYHAVRPDGTQRTFLSAAVAVTPEQGSELAAWEERGR